MRSIGVEEDGANRAEKDRENDEARIKPSPMGRGQGEGRTVENKAHQHRCARWFKAEFSPRWLPRPGPLPAGRGGAVAVSDSRARPRFRPSANRRKANTTVA
jgi:hypothetical protein